MDVRIPDDLPPFGNLPEPDEHDPADGAPPAAGHDRVTQEAAHADGAAPVKPNGKRVRVGAERVRIQTSGDKLAENIDEAVAVLANDADIYTQGPTLVLVTRADETDKDKRTIVGTPLVGPLGVPTLRERLTRLAETQKWLSKQEKWVACVPSDHLLLDFWRVAFGPGSASWSASSKRRA